MGKMGLAGASLVAAVPGGILFFLLVMTAASNLGAMPTLLQVLAITVMVIGLAMMLFPLYLLIWYRGSRVVLAKDKKPAATAGVAAAGAAGGGALAESFLDDFNPSTDELLGDQREEEVFGETVQFDSSSDLSAVDEFDDSATQEFSGDLGEFEAVEGFDSSTDLGTLEADSGHLETTEFFGEDLLEAVEADDAGSESELLAGEGLQDEFDFEFFDDEDEKKS